MKYLSILAFVLPLPAFAQLSTSPSGGPFEEMLRNILQFSNDVLIPFVIGIGFLVFVAGMFWYFILGGANEAQRESGRKLMINATFGFVIIIIFFGLINMLTTTTGLEGESLKHIPQVPIPAE